MACPVCRGDGQCSALLHQVYVEQAAERARYGEPQLVPCQCGHEYAAHERFGCWAQRAHGFCGCPQFAPPTREAAEE